MSGTVPDVRSLLVPALAVALGCAAPAGDPASPWLVSSGTPVAGSDDGDPELACVDGDGPCSANAFCSATTDDPRCLCPGNDITRCVPEPVGTCVKAAAGDGLSCFPTAGVTTGFCRAGRCEPP